MKTRSTRLIQKTALTATIVKVTTPKTAPTAVRVSMLKPCSRASGLPQVVLRRTYAGVQVRTRNNTFTAKPVVALPTVTARQPFNAPKSKIRSAINGNRVLQSTTYPRLQPTARDHYIHFTSDSRKLNELSPLPLSLLPDAIRDVAHRRQRIRKMP